MLLWGCVATLNKNCEMVPLFDCRGVFKLHSIMIQTGEQDWFKILDQAVVSYNNTPRSTTKETPYKILYGMDNPPAGMVTTSGTKGGTK